MQCKQLHFFKLKTAASKDKKINQLHCSSSSSLSLVLHLPAVVTASLLLLLFGWYVSEVLQHACFLYLLRVCVPLIHRGSAVPLLPVWTNAFVTDFHSENPCLCCHKYRSFVIQP